jgi:sorbitol-6-phosphate 2-dehydrogenase
MSAVETINTIAPVLRMQLAKDGVCPVVRFVEQTGRDAVAITGENAKTVPAGTEAVTVAGVGAFEIDYHQDSAGRVAGKVMIVTGAAQGFGLEIAQDLVSQGANVVLADINSAEAAKQADALCRQYGPSRAMAVAMNVTDLASIEAAIHAAVKTYGGFDVFISNAGVLKAESVKTQPEKDFDFVTAVNYKGYFLCTQVVSKILALQHQVNPDYRSDIIQINSKSGLVGSNRNGAYAGGKFGGIGLTQSFALELVEDGIKVNSICPGNFFDGPLWSNPDNGLFVQYLRTGKVPGAKTIEDVKHFYEAKVPLKRGCTTPDVMAAVYYLIEQQYETGQAVPVTGGQVMLH